MRERRARRRSARGFTLVELLISLGLGAVLAGGMLAVTRAQLSAFQLNERSMGAEESARTGAAFLEQSLRKLCPGTPTGQVFVNVPGAAQVTRACVLWFDGAAVAAGSFTTGTTGAQGTKADAVELIAQQGPAQMTTAGDIVGRTVDIPTTAGFAVGDYVLISNFGAAHLVLVSAVTATRLSFAAPTAAITPTVAPGFLWAAGQMVVRVQAVAYYVDATVAGGATTFSLMLDPDIFSGSHVDAQVLAEGTEDFQISLGVDANSDGVLTENSTTPSTDEWTGNGSGEAAPALPWTMDAGVQPKQIRVTLLARTALSYAGPPPVIGPIEDRAASSYLPVTSPSSPRYRPMNLVVAPRSWNLNQ